LGNYGFDKVYLGGEVCKWLYVMKGRLQMDEGAISRLAICLSLGEWYAPDLSLIDQEGGKTFSVASLSGPPLISSLLFAFLRQRMFDDGLDPHDQVELERQFQAHLARGMLALGVRVKHLADVGRLVQEAQERFRQSHPGAGEGDLDATPQGAESAFSTAASEEEQASPVVPMGAPNGGAAQVECAAETAATSQLLQTDDGTQSAQTGDANVLWGALLPPPVNVAGPKRSARLKRGVASSRKKRHKRR
jgi:DNA sulfur modification protein DndE